MRSDPEMEFSAAEVVLTVVCLLLVQSGIAVDGVHQDSLVAICSGQVTICAGFLMVHRLAAAQQLSSDGSRHADDHYDDGDDE